MSEDDVVDPDSAVKALEDIASALQNATNEEKEAFVAACAEEADSLQIAGAPYSNPKTLEFIRGLPESLGLCS